MKLNLPPFSRLFARKKKKLRLSTARRASASGAEFDETEPNMKLSRALLIVLLLHVVAVGGIIAFNAIKSRQSVADAVVSPARAQTSPSATPQRELKPSRSLAPKADKKSTSEGTKFYTVAKGDTPVTIAKKFKVPFDELLAANHVDDPRKLKVGQKLIIPMKAKPKKSDG